MDRRKVWFVGGSRNGLGEVVVPLKATLIFADGELAVPDADGAIEYRLNATVEHYHLEPVPASEGIEPFSAYFLQGMDCDQSQLRLAAILKKIAPQPAQP